jgi:hypothetical protein
MNAQVFMFLITIVLVINLFKGFKKLDMSILNGKNVSSGITGIQAIVFSGTTNKMIPLISILSITKIIA